MWLFGPDAAHHHAVYRRRGAVRLCNQAVDPTCGSPHLCSFAAVFDGEKRKIEKLMSRRKLKRGCESASVVCSGCGFLAAFLRAL